MYFKVYGIFISLFSLCLTKWGREYFILFIFYQFINILFLDFFSYTSLWENHTFPSLFCSKKNKLLLYPCQFSIFCKKDFVFTLFVTFTKTSRKPLNAIYNNQHFFSQKTLKWIQYQHAFTIQIWVGVMQRPRSQNKYCEPSYWSAYLSNID